FRGNVGACAIIELRHRLDQLAHGRLQSGKGKIESWAAQHRAGQIESPRSAGSSTAFQRRPARITKSKQLRGLVESLAGRVIERGAEPAVASGGFDHQQLAMATRNQQQEIGEGNL